MTLGIDFGIGIGVSLCYRLKIEDLKPRERPPESTVPGALASRYIIVLQIRTQCALDVLGVVTL
jgi:hypothetical protein